MYRRMTIEEFANLPDGSSCYVYNNTNREGNKVTRPRGQLFLVLKDGATKVDVLIPDTWLPVDLTAYAPLNVIKASIDLRNFIRSEALILMATDEARAILASSDAQAEIADMRKRQSERPLPVQSPSTLSEKFTIDTGSGVPKAIVEEVELVASPLEKLVASVNNGNVSDKEAVASLVSLKPTPNDVIAVLSSIADNTSSFFSALTAIIEDANDVAVKGDSFR